MCSIVFETFPLTNLTESHPWFVRFSRRFLLPCRACSWFGVSKQSGGKTDLISSSKRQKGERSVSFSFNTGITWETSRDVKERYVPVLCCVCEKPKTRTRRKTKNKKTVWHKRGVKCFVTFDVEVQDQRKMGGICDWPLSDLIKCLRKHPEGVGQTINPLMKQPPRLKHKQNWKKARSFSFLQQQQKKRRSKKGEKKKRPPQRQREWMSQMSNSRCLIPISSCFVSVGVGASTTKTLPKIVALWQLSPNQQNQNNKTINKKKRSKWVVWKKSVCVWCVCVVCGEPVVGSKNSESDWAEGQSLRIVLSDFPVERKKLSSMCRFDPPSRNEECSQNDAQKQERNKQNQHERGWEWRSHDAFNMTNKHNKGRNATKNRDILLICWIYLKLQLFIWFQSFNSFVFGLCVVFCCQISELEAECRKCCPTNNPQARSQKTTKQNNNKHTTKTFTKTFTKTHNTTKNCDILLLI